MILVIAHGVGMGAGGRATAEERTASMLVPVRLEPGYRVRVRVEQLGGTGSLLVVPGGSGVTVQGPVRPDPS